MAATLEAFTCAVARTVVWAAMANMASGGFRSVGNGCVCGNARVKARPLGDTRKTAGSAEISSARGRRRANQRREIQFAVWGSLEKSAGRNNAPCRSSSRGFRTRPRSLSDASAMAQRSISSFFFKGGGGHAPPPRAPATGSVSYTHLTLPTKA